MQLKRFDPIKAETKMTILCYEELRELKTFKERYDYLNLHGYVGEVTFGWKRYLNQIFYNSAEWKAIRNQVIARDEGCDLGLKGHEIYGQVYIHHMNPITEYDIKNHTLFLISPRYLICTSFDTHQAIHYGNDSLLFDTLTERSPNDMCPWKE